MARQAALAFVKRTLERCHKFENTGKSCFSEPLFKDKFLSGSSNLNGARPADTSTEGEPTKPYASIHSLEGRFSGISFGVQGKNSDNLPNIQCICKHVFFMSTVISWAKCLVGFLLSADFFCPFCFVACGMI